MFLDSTGTILAAIVYLPESSCFFPVNAKRAGLEPGVFGNGRIAGVELTDPLPQPVYEGPLPAGQAMGRDLPPFSHPFRGRPAGKSPNTLRRVFPPQLRLGRIPFCSTLPHAASPALRHAGSRPAPLGQQTGPDRCRECHEFRKITVWNVASADAIAAAGNGNLPASVAGLLLAALAAKPVGPAGALAVEGGRADTENPGRLRQ